MTNSIISAKEVIQGGVMKATGSNVRFDTASIASHVEDAEIRFILPILGKNFYNKLISEKQTDDSNYNIQTGPVLNKFEDADLEKLYFDYLRKLCAYAVKIQSLPFTALEDTTKGVMLNDTEFAKNQGIKGVEYLQNEYIKTFNIRVEMLKEHLCSNKNKYTPFLFDLDYCINCNSSNTIQQNNYTGIIFH